VNAAERLLETLARCRARLRRVAFARHALVTGLGGIVAVEAVVRIARPAEPASVTFAGAVLAVALVAAAALAHRQTPTLTQAAALLDSRLQLEDRVATALACLGQKDPVAGLVLRDACVRLDFDPRAVFPFTAPPRLRLLVTSFVVAQVLLGLHALSTERPVARPSDPFRTAADARPASGAAPAAATQAQGATVPSASAAVVPAPERGRSAPTATSAATTASPTRSREALGPSGREGAPQVAAPLSEPAGSQPALRPAGRESDSRTATSGGRDEAERRAAHTQSRLDGAAPRDARVSGAGGGEGGGGAGGAAGRAGAGATAAGQRTPADAGVEASYALAWVRAEAALGQARVPDDLRAAVKNYFLALRDRPRP
jgi:hypothetical protein